MQSDIKFENDSILKLTEYTQSYKQLFGYVQFSLENWCSAILNNKATMNALWRVIDKHSNKQFHFEMNGTNKTSVMTMTDLSNYRAVSLTFLTSKVMESTVKTSYYELLFGKQIIIY